MERLLTLFNSQANVDMAAATSQSVLCDCVFKQKGNYFIKYVNFNLSLLCATSGALYENAGMASQGLGSFCQRLGYQAWGFIQPFTGSFANQFSSNEITAGTYSSLFFPVNKSVPVNALYQGNNLRFQCDVTWFANPPGQALTDLQTGANTLTIYLYVTALIDVLAPGEEKKLMFEHKPAGERFDFSPDGSSWKQNLL